MDAIKKIQNEIIRQRERIKKGEEILNEIPIHMSSYQKIALDIHRRHLLAFEKELTKLKNAKNT